MQAATCDLPSSSSAASAPSGGATDTSHTLTGIGPVELQLHKHHTVPQRLRPDEARVRIYASCLDEWDIRMRNVEFPEFCRPPYTPSYACSGVVESLGYESLHFKVGDEVVVLIALDSKLGGLAEYTVQPIINMFLKPPSLSHEHACAMVWSGIQGMTCLNYQLKIKPGDRILLCTANVCTDLILSSLAGLFGAKLIVATHTPQAYALFTEVPPASSSTSASTAAPASSSGASLPPPLNPLAHILRVVDCSAASFGSDAAVVAAVMEETGGLGVDGIIDLQHSHDEWNYLHMQHVTQKKHNQTQPESQHQKDDQAAAAAGIDASLAADSTADPSSTSADDDASIDSALHLASSLLADLDVADGMLPPSSAALSSAPLIPSNPIHLPALVSCLAVSGRLVTSTPNLQIDPPLSRQLFLRGSSVAYAFPQSWLLGGTQRGRFAHLVLELLSLAAAGTLQPIIHSRFTLDKVASAWKTLVAGCPVGKIVLYQPAAAASAASSSTAASSGAASKQTAAAAMASDRQY